jgi:tripartite motif-containing protein 71
MIHPALSLVSIALIGFLAAPPAPQASGFSTAPARIAGFAAPQGDRVAATFPGENCVRLFDGSGNLLKEFGELPRPLGLAAANGRVYIGLGAHGAVRVFDLQGKPRGELGAGLHEFERPTDIAVSPLDGRVHVLDAGRGEVRVFDPQTLQEVGRVGQGVLQQPAGLAVRTDGSVLVGDLIHGRVEVYDAAGLYAGDFTVFGSSAGQTVRPTGIALDAAGRVYVVDAFLDTVQVFDAQGALLATRGEFGAGPGKMRNPLALWVSGRDGRIWVTDSGDRELEVFPMVP